MEKSIIKEGIFRLGVEKLSSSQINKMDWESLDLRIKTWVEAVKISTSTLFTGERILCDQVFGSSETIRESCFVDISRDEALLLFSFPELVSGKSKKSPPPENMFRALDMYTVISENWANVAWDGACDGIERLDFVWRRRFWTNPARIYRIWEDRSSLGMCGAPVNSGCGWVLQNGGGILGQ
ncbi:hypothetical protein Tsubulata_033900 [Turnera subulata]|uniref:Exocyst subunit Exo70 family protein n=1 Tax=Turnera subulata TaxID=218843 RepID=A0A9Q0JEY1_9ROSI|nr:hypothetical protein Tsubulata_033900 [Turnera subulata]